MTYTIAGTGSRSLAAESLAVQLKVRLQVIDRLEVLKVLYGDLRGVSGLTEGFDEVMAAACYLKGIPYTACIPHRGYGDYYWRRNSVTGQDRYAEFQALVERADKVEYVCSSIYQGGVHSNFIRNNRMVELGDEFLVYDPSSPGTRHCVKEIRRAKLPYTVVAA